MHDERMARARERMSELGVDVMLLSLGADLPYLTGYEAMPLERLTMLVLPRDGAATLVVPRLEAPRVRERPDDFALRPWGETEDPVAIVADLVRSAGINAYACEPLMVGDRLLGTLSFASRQRRRFDPDDLSFFRAIAKHVALARDRAQRRVLAAKP